MSHVSRVENKRVFENALRNDFLSSGKLVTIKRQLITRGRVLEYGHWKDLDPRAMEMAQPLECLSCKDDNLRSTL